MERQTMVTYFVGFNGFIPVYAIHYLMIGKTNHDNEVTDHEAKGHRIFSYCRKSFKQKDRDEKV